MNQTFTPQFEQHCDAALVWIARFRGEATEQDDRDFALWLAADNGHRQAMDLMPELRDDPGSMRYLPLAGPQRVAPAQRQQSCRHWLAALHRVFYSVPMNTCRLHAAVGSARATPWTPHGSWHGNVVKLSLMRSQLPNSLTNWPAIPAPVSLWAAVKWPRSPYRVCSASTTQTPSFKPSNAALACASPQASTTPALCSRSRSG